MHENFDTKYTRNDYQLYHLKITCAILLFVPLKIE